MELLSLAKIILEKYSNDEHEFEMHTFNKVAKLEGIGVFCSGDKIKVFEGNGDGSDDKIMTYSEFLENYTFVIKPDIIETLCKED